MAITGLILLGIVAGWSFAALALSRAVIYFIDSREAMSDDALDLAESMLRGVAPPLFWLLDKHIRKVR